MTRWSVSARASTGVRCAAIALGFLALAAAAARPAFAATSGPPDPTAAAAAAEPGVGVQDSSINGCDGMESRAANPQYSAAAAAMTDPHWRGLHVSTARYSTPWDIAYQHDNGDPTGRANAALQVEQLCLDYWLTVAAANHVQPEIAFEPDYNDQNTYRGKDQHIVVPDIGRYRAAMDAFAAIYSSCTAFGGTATTCNLPPVPAGFPHPPAGGMARVRIISPWGEPDFSGHAPCTKGKTCAGFMQLPPKFFMPKGGREFGDPDCRKPMTAETCGPVLAAQMWVAVADRCHGCTVIAGDFSSAPFGRTSSYLVTYSRHLDGRRPSVWGIHPYTDIGHIEDFYGGVRRTKPRLGDTLVGQFAAELDNLGYHSHTDIWLNEISTFFQFGLSDAFHKTWTRPVQARAARYLLDELSRAGGKTTARQPVVTRIYYFRYADGAGFPRWALVVGGQPEPVYTVFANRPRPH